MSKMMIWGLVTFIILVVTATVWFVLHNNAEIRKLEEQTKSATLLKRQKEQLQMKDENGHFHADGTFHEGQHESIESTPSGNYNPTQILIPEGITDPDVLAAWKRLDYISKNRHKWGQFSPRALELMDELTPMWNLEGILEDSSEDISEDIILLLDELSKLRDPRSADLLVSYQMDSGISGNPVDDALVAMGPASVPALISRMDDISGKFFLSTPLSLLPRIVITHRSELGGIVEHIIIPKLEEIATVAHAQGIDNFAVANKSYAIIALETILQRPKNQ